MCQSWTKYTEQVDLEQKVNLWVVCMQNVRNKSKQHDVVMSMNEHFWLSGVLVAMFTSRTVYRLASWWGHAFRTAVGWFGKVRLAWAARSTQPKMVLANVLKSCTGQCHIDHVTCRVSFNPYNCVVDNIYQTQLKARVKVLYIIFAHS